MNELKVFNNREFGEVRTVEINGEPWFVANDICYALDLTNTTMAMSRLDDDERTKFNLGRQGEANVVNEFGLYNLVLASRKPEAKQFKRWITHDVIPTIRRHGAYMTDGIIERTLQDPDYLIQLATTLKEERAKRQLAEAENYKNKPMVLFAESVQASDNSCLIGELAKIISQNGVSIGQNRLFEWLRENGYLIKGGERRNQPTQYSMELGLMEIKKRTIDNPDGSIRVTVTTKVTGKGQIYFINKFLS